MPTNITEENLMKLIADKKGKKLMVKALDNSKITTGNGKVRGQVKLKLRTSRRLYTLTVPDAKHAKAIVKGCKDMVDIEYVDAGSTDASTHKKTK